MSEVVGIDRPRIAQLVACAMVDDGPDGIEARRMLGQLKEAGTLAMEEMAAMFGGGAEEVTPMEQLDEDEQWLAAPLADAVEALYEPADESGVALLSVAAEDCTVVVICIRDDFDVGGKKVAKHLGEAVLSALE